MFGWQILGDDRTRGNDRGNDRAVADRNALENGRAGSNKAIFSDPNW